LARAVGLEKIKKGARLLLEREIATEILVDCPDWRTHEDYIKNIPKKIPKNDIRRRIAPTPEQDYYECLYFWNCRESISPNDYNAKTKELESIRVMLKDDIAEHYKETIALLKRCQNRQLFTDMQLP
jgi:hypothetical protein